MRVVWEGLAVHGCHSPRWTRVRLVTSRDRLKVIEPRRFSGGMQLGQTFRIGSQEYAQPVLRTFMLLSVAGDSPTTSL